MLILGIETSCDETGVALYDDQRGLIDHALYSQVELHAKYGGVVPELASRDHLRKLYPLLKDLLQRNEIGFNQLKAIAYTAGPGLMGALIVGASIAKALAFALNIPLFPINHLEAHLLTPFMERSKPVFPFLGLLVSGGNTLLVQSEGLGKYRVLGETLDDAAGEVFDKVAKKMGFAYPGGAELSRLADETETASFKFPVPMQRSKSLDFSFSGLKTYALNYLTKLTSDRYGEVAFAFQEAVVNGLLDKTKKALKQEQVKTLVLAGGVSANLRLRRALEVLAHKERVNLFLPKAKWSGDNGVMIAYTGFLYFNKKRLKATDQLLVYPRLALAGLEDDLVKYYEAN